MSDVPAFLSFKRAKFQTRLPFDRLYTAGHMWLRKTDDDLWQVGLTHFALRMLGDPVEVDFEQEAGSAVQTGDVVGWLEGFKAVTDLFAPMNGHFAGGNAALEADISSVHDSAYERGWLFEMKGEPGADCVDADGYAAVLDANIDKMLGVNEQGAEANQ